MPDFTLLQPRASASYETRALLENMVGVLTKELEKAQSIIRAQQAIDESKGAQLVIQSMELIRLKESV